MGLLIPEDKIIEIISKKIYEKTWTPNDVSNFKIGDNQIIFCIDTLVGSTDVPNNMNLRDATRKAAVAVVSDFASKGVEVDIMLFSLCLPEIYTKKDVEQISEGLNDAAKEYSFIILGGDTNQSTDFMITFCGIGLNQNDVINRSEAKPGDIIATTGRYGLHALGLKILLSKEEPKNGEEIEAVQAFLKPVARVKEGAYAISSGSVTSSIDSSDGLLRSLNQLANTSNVKIIIDELPTHESIIESAKKRKMDLDKLVLEGGEEYELIFSVKRKEWPKLKKLFQTKKFSIYKIGKVETGSGVYLVRNDKIVKLEGSGWQHFQK